jgi:dTDP-4-amino-4,6-dideoxygalactose transaminase
METSNGAQTAADARQHALPGPQVRSPEGWAVPLSSPQISDADLVDVVDTYRSGWLAMGPRTAELESAFRSYLGTGDAIAVSSCSAALHIASVAAGFGPGDTVIVPSLTFAATANAVASTGARPRFADIRDLQHPWLSVDAVADTLEPSTKGIVNVAYGGHLGECESLADLAAREGIVLLEDAAHASGSWVDGRHAGTIGLAGALSFSASKNLGVGEGGMLLTGSEELADRARALRWHGISSAIWERHRSAAPSYEVTEAGFNYRIDDPRAALVKARLGRLDEENRRRAEIDAGYREALESAAGLTATAPPPPGTRASHCLFTVVLDRGVDRDRFRRSLAERGVQTSVHFPPLHLSPAHAGNGGPLPVTKEYAARTVSMPIFPHMEPWQQELVVEATREALAQQSSSVVAS